MDLPLPNSAIAAVLRIGQRFSGQYLLPCLPRCYCDVYSETEHKIAICGFAYYGSESTVLLDDIRPTRLFGALGKSDTGVWRKPFEAFGGPGSLTPRHYPGITRRFSVLQEMSCSGS